MKILKRTIDLTCVDMAVQCYKKILSMDSYKRAKKKGYDTDLDNMSKLKTILGG